ncbi:hypothetical protein JTE90_008646 [Oedothorax gibbosus]|uniref:Uncharacterized protein n=1 Tax=Oedothorax gibbosus TaxID=931172 RepID=A0AAV6TZ80_9ARAC|nr:hypothetical protein JTE90_008646 [Oedothorax gibbosus]
MSERHKRRKTKALVDKHMLDLQEASEPSTESSAHEFDVDEAANFLDVSEEISSSDTDGELPIPNFIGENVELGQQLRDCFIKHRVTHSCINDVLQILKQHHPELPSDARTLLSTPQNVKVDTLSNGEYAHFGLRSGIVEKLKFGLKD